MYVGKADSRSIAVASAEPAATARIAPPTSGGSRVGAGGSLPGERLHVDRTPLNYAPLSALCLLIRSSSSGSGNTMVELCSAPMSVSVCR